MSSWAFGCGTFEWPFYKKRRQKLLLLLFTSCVFVQQQQLLLTMLLPSTVAVSASGILYVVAPQSQAKQRESALSSDTLFAQVVGNESEGGIRSVCICIGKPARPSGVLMGAYSSV